MRSALMAALVLLTGCSVVGVTADPDAVSLEHPQPEAMEVSGWLEFPALTLHAASGAEAPKSPFLRGRISGGWFTPTGNIEGALLEAPARRVLVRGSLELSTRAFLSSGSSRTPRGAFIEGVQDQETGAFYPVEQVRAPLGTKQP